MLINQLVSKPSLGELILTHSERKEKWDIGEGRFSITPKKDYFLLNFWILSEFDAGPEGHESVWQGPTLEIFVKIHQNPITVQTLEILVPNKKDVKDEWGINYQTCFYIQHHEELKDAVLKISKSAKNKFRLEFRAFPSDSPNSFEISGFSELDLNDSLKRYW